MKVKYVGEGPSQFEQFGFVFKGDGYTEVPDDHEKADKFRNNPDFEVQGAKKADEAETVETTNPEYEATAAELESLGVKVDRRKGLAALQDQLAKAKEPKGGEA